jgi:hypothetical protein
MTSCSKIGCIFYAQRRPQANTHRYYPVDDDEPNQHAQFPPKEFGEII